MDVPNFHSKSTGYKLLPFVANANDMGRHVCHPTDMKIEARLEGEKASVTINNEVLKALCLPV